jgi:hypothetical protein
LVEIQEVREIKDMAGFNGFSMLSEGASMLLNGAKRGARFAGLGQLRSAARAGWGRNWGGVKSGLYGFASGAPYAAGSTRNIQAQLMRGAITGGAIGLGARYGVRRAMGKKNPFWGE